MTKKIGYFLLVMMIICTLLLLVATAGRGLQNSGPSQTGPGQNTLNQPSETDPEGDAGAQPKETALQCVRRILDGENLNRTARSHWVWDAELNPQEEATGTSQTSHGWALALLAAEREMDPVSAFLVLERKGLYTREADDSGAMAADVFEVPLQEAGEYAYSEEGARKLLTDLLILASELEDGLEMETGLLGANDAVDPGQVSLDQQGNCYYGYFISSGQRSTHILCFYLRSGTDGKTINDVSFRILNLRSAEGSREALEVLDRRGDTQAAALIAAAELLLTGQTQAGQGMVPFTRQVTSFTATIERTRFDAEDEMGMLTNYRLRKA